MADSNPLQNLVHQMTDAYLVDPATPPQWLAYLHAVKASLLMGTTQAGPITHVTAPTPSHVDRARLAGEHSKKGRSPDPKREEVLKAAVAVLELLGDANSPMKTSEIWEHFSEEERSKIGGAEPKGNLSAMMHHSPLFVSHGRSGWTLAKDAARGLSEAPHVNVADDIHQQRSVHTFTA